MTKPNLPPIAHSHSSMTMFQQCPYRYYRQRIVKDIVEEQGEAAAWGDQVHKALEARVGDNVPLPTNMSQYEKAAAKVAALSGTKIVEQELAITSSWERTEWKSPTAWFRAKVDLTVVRPDARELLVIDYKTGASKYGAKRQEERYAAVLFAVNPDIDTIRVRWMYLKEDHVARHDYVRDQWADLAESITSVARAIDTSRANTMWPKIPSGLCRAWCPVLDCQHNGKGGIA